MKENIILGGGISGLIFQFYNPEFLLITDSFGGMLENEKDFGVMTLWDTKTTRQLLTDLEIEIKPKHSDIHYYFNGKIYKEAPSLLREEHIRKKMGPLSSLIDFKDLTLSTDKTNYIPSLKVDFIELLKKLRNKLNRHIVGRVTKINDEYVIVNIGEENKLDYHTHMFKYNALISTLPAFVFWDIWNGKNCKEICNLDEFNYTSTTNISMKKLEGKLKSKLIDSGCLSENFQHYVYFMDDSPYHRLSRTTSGKYCIQFPGEYSIEKVSKILDIPISKLKIRINKIGQFVSHKGNIPPDNIMFLGRHAQWDYKIKVQDIVRFSMFSKFMWHRMRQVQTRFNKNFIKFNEITFEERQRKTEKWLLHLFSEVNEFLNEINWKMHRTHKEVFRQKIIEEWIDIFKFLLGLADVWGITSLEIFNMFMEKSKIVEQKYYKEMEEKDEGVSREESSK